MADSTSPERFPNLGKLSIAILEHLIKPVIGEKAIREIKAPLIKKDEQDKVLRALEQAEQRFTEESEDRQTTQLVLNLPLANLPSVSQAVVAFYNNPSDSGLRNVLREQLRKDSPELSTPETDAAVNAYLSILREEFINISKEFRDKSSTYAVVKTEEHTARIAERLGQLAQKFVTEDVAQAKTPSALHSLPSPPADFTGRKDELDKLLQHFEKGAMISGLTGMAGVGKTALALIVAHRLVEYYPDAQIFIDLKGTSATPLTPTDAMKDVINRFEPQADLRQAKDEQIAALYRSLLNGKRALLLFDKMSDATQVKPLIPPPTCALLVTSRKHFTVAGLQPVRLDVMSEPDARDLLLRICARIGGHADEIAKLCGYLPLALRIAGSALTEHVDISPTDYIARLKQQRLKLLKSEDDHDLNVEAAFALSYELLPLEKQAHWRALAVFPALFSWIAAAEVWGLEEQGAQEILSDFYRANIVQFDEEKQRYQLHDLLREFASQRLPDNERATAQLRHAQHFVKIARTADQLYLQGKALEGLALFNVEWENIKAGQAWAAGNFAAYELAARLCNDYPAVSAHNLVLQVAPKERIEWLESAIKAAGILGDRHGEGYHLGNLGIAYYDLGETGKAIEFFERALAFSRAVGDRHSEGNQLCNLGNAYHDLGDIRKAIEVQEQALAIARAIGDRRGEGRRLGNLGLAYAALGDTRKAIQFYELALAIAREIGDRHDEGNALGNLGDACARPGETHKAIEFYKQALAIGVLIGDRRVQGHQLGNLGLAYAELGETHKAIEFMEQALNIFDVFEPQYAERAQRYLERFKRQLSPKPSP